MAEHAEGSIHVDAPVDAVIAVVSDVAGYPAWTNGITEAEVLEATPDGRPHRARLCLDAGPMRDTLVVEYAWEDGPSPSVRWTLVEADLLTAMDGTYVVVAAGDGSDVRFELAVDLRVPVLGMIKRKAARTVVDSALGGLKKHVEA